MQQLPGKSFVHKADSQVYVYMLGSYGNFFFSHWQMRQSLIHLASEYANDDLAAGHMTNSVIFIG